MLTDKPVPASLELAQELSQSEEPVLRGYQQMEQFKVPSGFRGRSKLYVQLWWLVQSTLFAMSPQMMYGWRANLLRLFGARIGKSTIIRPSVKIPYPGNSP